MLPHVNETTRDGHGNAIGASSAGVIVVDVPRTRGWDGRPGDLVNVAEAKPGDRDYNGGRWMVTAIEWHTTPTQLTSAEQVLAAADSGSLSIGGVVKYFECPVIKVPGG
jgi:hypothetical protein